MHPLVHLSPHPPVQPEPHPPLHIDEQSLVHPKQFPVQLVVQSEHELLHVAVQLEHCVVHCTAHFVSQLTEHVSIQYDPHVFEQFRLQFIPQVE